MLSLRILRILKKFFNKTVAFSYLLRGSGQTFHPWVSICKWDLGWALAAQMSSASRSQPPGEGRGPPAAATTSFGPAQGTHLWLPAPSPVEEHAVCPVRCRQLRVT